MRVRKRGKEEVEMECTRSGFGFSSLPFTESFSPTISLPFKTPHAQRNTLVGCLTLNMRVGRPFISGSCLGETRQIFLVSLFFFGLAFTKLDSAVRIVVRIE